MHPFRNQFILSRGLEFRSAELTRRLPPWRMVTRGGRDSDSNRLERVACAIIGPNRRTDHADGNEPAIGEASLDGGNAHCGSAHDGSSRRDGQSQTIRSERKLDSG